jgi:hypothetical protein
MNDYAEQAYLSMQTPPEAAAPPGVNMLVNPRARANRADVARRLMGTQYSDQEREGVIARMQADAEDAQPMTATYGGKSFQMAQSPRRDLALSYLEQLRNTKSDNLRSEDEKWRKDLIANRDKTGQDRWNQTMGERTRAALAKEKADAEAAAFTRLQAQPDMDTKNWELAQKKDPRAREISGIKERLSLPGLERSYREQLMRRETELNSTDSRAPGQLMTPGSGPMMPGRGGDGYTGPMMEVDYVQLMDKGTIAGQIEGAKGAVESLGEVGWYQGRLLSPLAKQAKSFVAAAIADMVAEGASPQKARAMVMAKVLAGSSPTVRAIFTNVVSPPTAPGAAPDAAPAPQAQSAFPALRKTTDPRGPHVSSRP